MVCFLSHLIPSLLQLDCLLLFSSPPSSSSLGVFGNFSLQLTDQGLEYYLIRGVDWYPH
jgi:hypothetical protein